MARPQSPTESAKFLFINFPSRADMSPVEPVLIQTDCPRPLSEAGEVAAPLSHLGIAFMTHLFILLFVCSSIITGPLRVYAQEPSPPPAQSEPKDNELEALRKRMEEQSIHIEQLQQALQQQAILIEQQQQ